MLRRTNSKLVVVRAAVMASIASRKRVLRRTRGRKMPEDSMGAPAAGSREEFKGINERIYIPYHAPYGSVQGSKDPVPVFAAVSECDCRRCAWTDSSGSPTL